jgi:hypothetical protein
MQITIRVSRNLKCAGVDMRVPLNSISNESIDKSLDIGHVNQMPGVPGVTGTVTGLVFMILDMHLRLPYLSRRLIWFNENVNHFFLFSYQIMEHQKLLSCQCLLAALLYGT